MKPEDEFLKEKGVVPSISFKDGNPHTISIVQRKLDSITDPQTGKPITGVAYLVKENGEQKRFFTASPRLVQLLRDVDENEEIVVKMKSVKGADGFKSTYVVDRMAEEEPKTKKKAKEETEDVDLDDIPF